MYCMHSTACLTLPICHKELGPGTEYVRLADTSLHLKALLIGSVFLVAFLTLSLVTQYPIDRSVPQTIV